jgi:two-component system, NtrC family, sensor kinase
MEDRVSTLISRALIDYLKKSGVDLDSFFSSSEFSKDSLSSPRKWISNEELITLFYQAQQATGEIQIAYQTGRTLVESRKKEFQNQALISNKNVEKNILALLAWVETIYPLVRIDVSKPAPNQWQVRVSKKKQYIHTYDHCRFLKGVLEGIVIVSGGIVENIQEQACMIPSRKCEESGKLSPIIESGEKTEKYEGAASQLPIDKDNLDKIDFEQEQPAPRADSKHDCCIYSLQWRDGRSLMKKAWHRSGSNLAEFFKAVLSLEQSPMVDSKTFQQVSSKWKHWLNWEDSYSLTKAKYLAYLGVLVLSALPISGGFFSFMNNYLFTGFSNIALSCLILVFGVGITKLQISYARQLHRQKEQADQFMQQAGVGVTMINQKYEIVFANPQIVDLYGEVLGKKCYRAFRWEDGPCLECKIQKSFKEKVQTRMETKNITREGQERWFYNNSTPMLDWRGQVTGVLNISTDITERKQLEDELARNQAALVASERKYRNFIDNAADAILITDPEGVLIEASSQFFQLLEIKDEKETRDKKILESMVYGNDGKQKLSLISKAMVLDKSPKEFELRLQCPGGRVIDAEVRAIPILVEGKISWMQFIMRDITGRKQSEFEKNLLLSVSKAIKDAPNLQELLDHALKGICAIMDVPIAAIFIKDKAQAQLQLAAQVGRSPEAIKQLARIAIDGSANNIASRTAVLNRPIVVPNIRELKMDQKTRQRVDLMGVSSMICMPMVMEGVLQGVIQIANRDTNYFDDNKISILTQMANELAVGIARQRLRDALEESNRQLVKKHQELENTHLQLLQSEKMASIGQLAAGIAHEINNPMGFINANLNVLDEYREDLREIFSAYEGLVAQTTPDTFTGAASTQLQELSRLKGKLDVPALFEDFKATVRESKEGADRVKKIIMNLKEFSHPTKGTPEWADINAGLESTLNIVWNELKYKAEVKKEYGELPKILCYPQELNQVFMNILLNAAQAIKEKGEIRLKTSAENNHICVQISDSGAGIPQELIQKIFDPFFTTKEVGKGTGLGLSISYGIVKKHNGEIKVESEPGKGSSFSVLLPVSGPETMAMAGNL